MGRGLGGWSSHISETTSRGCGLLADRRTKRLAAGPDHLGFEAPSAEEKPGRTSPVAADRVGDHGASGGRCVLRTAELMPQIAGTPGPMPQIDGTCLTCDGKGHQALDQQGITPAEVRWALYGPLRQALMRIALKIYSHRSD